jgi:gamma-glutamyltranspeptidase/glutathione hydrolase
MIRLARIACIALAVSLVPLATRGQDARGFPPAGTTQSVAARNGMVAAQETRAARVGLEILRKGGNAVDAAVATGFALAVTYPRAGNIGGGGFMLIHVAGRNEAVAIDYRETAPAATTRDVFLDAQGEADPVKSRDSGLAVGVPGTVAGLALAHERYGSGRFTLAELIAPAIGLALGIPVEDDTADSLPNAQPRLARWPSSARIFLKPDGTPLGAGDTLVQKDLAGTLSAIARAGPSAFYRGPIAEKIVAAVRGAGGLMTLEDLQSYRALVRTPVRGSYRGYDILSMPPSSSGGVLLIQMLNVLEGFRLREMDSAAALHVMIEAMRHAYADRAEFLADPEFVRAPQALTSKSYAAAVRERIDPQRARNSRDIRAGHPLPDRGGNTTHFSVIDRFGNAVANTTTLNFSYGVGLVAEGTGVLLNNELDDFAAKPGVPNAFGLIGGEANAPGPNKRPLSSMTPTIVLKDRRPFLITGSPGGSRIPTTVLQVVVNAIDHGMTIADAVAAPRIHHQWLPDEVRAEPGFAPEIVRGLEARGHRVITLTGQTSANSVMRAPAGIVGAADPRTRGALAAGY